MKIKYTQSKKLHKPEKYTQAKIKYTNLLLQKYTKTLYRALNLEDNHPPLVYTDTPHQYRSAKRVTKCLVNSVSVPEKPFFTIAASQKTFRKQLGFSCRWVQTLKWSARYFLQFSREKVALEKSIFVRGIHYLQYYLKCIGLPWTFF